MTYALTDNLSRNELLNCPVLKAAHRGNAIHELRQHADDLETKARRAMAIAMATRAAADLAEMEIENG